MTENSSTYRLSIQDRIRILTKSFDDASNRLHGLGSAVPADTLRSISELSDQLDKISKSIKQLEGEKNDLQALADIGQVVNSSLDLNDVLQIVMDTIIRLTEAERVFLMLRDEDGQLQTKMARNWEQESIHPSEFEVSKTITNRVAQDNSPLLTTNAQEDPRFGGQESIVTYSLRSILCVPMTVKGKVTGVIYTDNRIRTALFTETTKNLLTAFANQAAIAIENASLFESVRRTLAEVTELKNLMDNVFLSIASGVITADFENNITLVNESAGKILGYSDENIIGKPLTHILAEIAESLGSHITDARSGGQHIVGQEYRIDLPRRGQLDLSFNFSPLIDASAGTQGVAIVLEDLTERKRLEGQRRMFERMVSPQVIDQLDPDKLELGGKRVEITTLFADIRNFTSFSERLSPDQLINILNAYFSASGAAILEQEGTIDKFMGDAIMAWYNAPIPQPDHALRAVKSALGIQACVHQLHSQFPAESHLSFGVGIHYGEVVLGLVGTEMRLEYTAIGDSVNTAKRIQENTAPNQILISEPAYEFVRGQVHVRPHEPVIAKGKSAPITVYEVLGLL